MLGKVRVYDAFAGACEQNVQPISIDVQTIGVRAVFRHVPVAEKLACLAFITWANRVFVVTCWFFFAVTQNTYVVVTQMAGC